MENLKRHVEVLSNAIGERNFIYYQNLEKTAEYIKDAFKQFGYLPEEHIYYIEGKSYKNIIAVKSGTQQTDEFLIVCAHYDSVMGSPGADDNASGVAGLLEIARILKDNSLRNTIKFIAFTNEEPPFFMTEDMGSFRYVQEAKRKKDKIFGVLCLESIGYYSQERKSQTYPPGLGFFYPDKGNFIAFVSNFHSANFLKKIVYDFKRVSKFPAEYLIAPQIFVPAIGFSDHWSFWKFGYPAIMITDTAFYRTPYYHTGKDTYEKLDYRSLQELIEGLVYTIEKLF
ncbi:MAG: M20/M25/M40 family metallo-hydrolase [Candidatus Omnitrophica bacterium]|nr:M20/M25/M40 family metallo-hydrolase [Candidatus Omnitrophota bacterium]